MKQAATFSLEDGNDITALCWPADGIFAGDIGGGVRVWKASETEKRSHVDPEPTIRCEVHSLAVNSIDVHHHCVITSSLDGTVHKTSIENFDSEQIATEVEDPIQVCSTNDFILIGNASGTLFIYSDEGATLTATIPVFKDVPIVSICFKEDTGKIFVLSPHELAMVDIKTQKEEKRCLISAPEVTCAALTDDGYSCAVSATDGTVRMVDVVSFREVGLAVMEQCELNKIAALDYGKKFVVTSMVGMMRLLETRGMKAGTRLNIGKQPLLALAVNKEYGMMAVAKGDSFCLVCLT